MLKFKIGIAGISKTIENVEKLEQAVKQAYLNKLTESANKFRDKAKEVLHNSVNLEYSTGKLESSINSVIDEKRLTARVGPDMRIAPYAEWVEFGHFIGLSGQWWSGHHYMSRAWLEIKDEVAEEITKEIANALKNYAITTNNRVQHKGTGKFVGAVWAYII